MVKSVLVLLTSHGTLGSTGKPTGWYLPEFAHPFAEFANAGFKVVTTSPNGRKAPIDPSSIEAFKDDPVSTDFLNNKKDFYTNTIQLADLAGDAAAAKTTASGYDALFVPGGHGPMFDLAVNTDSHRLVAAFANAGKIVSAVCHGPAALVNVHVSADDPSSPYLLAGKKVNSFTDDEEREMGMQDAVPFLLETRLKEVGAKFEKADKWAEKVVVDGNFITGQNPASAKGVGQAIVKALSV